MSAAARSAATAAVPGLVTVIPTRRQFPVTIPTSRVIAPSCRVTDLNHVQLRVRDLTRSHEFYAVWFGFRPHVVLGRRRLVPSKRRGVRPRARAASEPDAFPSWFHLGFRLDSADDVRTLYGAMVEAGVPMRERLTEEASLVFFRCLDADGYLLEIYCE